MSDLMNDIADLATAMSQTQLRSELSVRTLDKALDIQARNALTLLNTLQVTAGSPSPASRLIDTIA